MKGAVEFIKKYGIDDAKQLISMGSGTCEIDDRFSFHTNDLKRLIESHELVEKLGGLSNCKKLIIDYGKSECADHLSYHVKNVESCQ